MLTDGNGPSNHNDPIVSAYEKHLAALSNPAEPAQEPVTTGPETPSLTDSSLADSNLGVLAYAAGIASETQSDPLAVAAEMYKVVEGLRGQKTGAQALRGAAVTPQPAPEVSEQSVEVPTAANPESVLAEEANAPFTAPTAVFAKPVFIDYETPAGTVTPAHDRLVSSPTPRVNWRARALATAAVATGVVLVVGVTRSAGGSAGRAEHYAAQGPAKKTSGESNRPAQGEHPPVAVTIPAPQERPHHAAPSPKPKHKSGAPRPTTSQPVPHIGSVNPASSTARQAPTAEAGAKSSLSSPVRPAAKRVSAHHTGSSSGSRITGGSGLSKALPSGGATAEVIRHKAVRTVHGNTGGTSAVAKSADKFTNSHTPKVEAPSGGDVLEPVASWHVGHAKGKSFDRVIKKTDEPKLTGGAGLGATVLAQSTSR